MSSIFYTFILSVILTIVSKPLKRDRNHHQFALLMQAFIMLSIVAIAILFPDL